MHEQPRSSCLIELDQTSGGSSSISNVLKVFRVNRYTQILTVYTGRRSSLCVHGRTHYTTRPRQSALLLYAGASFNIYIAISKGFYQVQNYRRIKPIFISLRHLLQQLFFLNSNLTERGCLVQLVTRRTRHDMIRHGVTLHYIRGWMFLFFLDITVCISPLLLLLLHLSEIIKMAKVALFQLLTSFLVALFYSLPRIKRSAHAFYFSSSEAYESLARLFPSRLFSFFLYLHINIIFLIFSHPSIPQ